MREPQGQTAAGYAGSLRRSWWIIALAVLVSVAVSFALSTRQSRLYSSTAVVTLQSLSLPANLVGVSNQLAVNQPDVYTASQAQLARSPQVLSSAVSNAHASGRAANALLHHSSVSASATANVLSFTVDAGDPAMSISLASAYAHAFVSSTAQRDVRAIDRILQPLRARIARVATGITNARNGNSAVALALTQRYSTLLAQSDQLESARSIIQFDLWAVQDANGALQVQPRTDRSILLGILIGLIIGVSLAFVREGRDSRPRTADEVEGVLAVRMLGAVPLLPRRLYRKGRLAMLAEPKGAASEAYRKLAIVLTAACSAQPTNSVMVVSAMPSEGKSTTIANVALAMARAGRRVVVIDFDLRNPMQHTLFATRRTPGVSDIAAGLATADAAFNIIPTPGAALAVIAAGSPVSDPGGLIQAQSMQDLLRWAESRADVVLLDTPPLLPFGDAVHLGTLAGAVFIVVRPGVVGREALVELSRELFDMRSARLGFVMTGTAISGARTYGYGYGDGDRLPHPGVQGRMGDPDLGAPVPEHE